MTIKLTNSYHNDIVTPVAQRKLVNKVSKAILKIHNKTKLSHIVCTGISGQGMAWPVGYVTKIPVAVIRKSGERSHGNPVEGSGILKNFVIIDDFICSGNTIKRILKLLSSKEEDPRKRDIELSCKAIILYNDSGSKHGELYKGLPIISI